MKQPLPFNDFHECPHCHGEAIYDDPTDEEDPFTTRGEECYEAKIEQLEAEIEKLREKKAEGLTWECITCECYEAHGFNGTWRIVYDSQSRCFDVLLDGDFVKETTTRIPTEAKAHAEELHQQAWRELVSKWEA